MIKLFLLSFTLVSVTYASHHSALTKDRGTVQGKNETEYNLRVFKALSKKTKLLGEIRLRDQEDNTFKSIRFGAYYRFQKNLKLGLFYSAQTGLLHDDDWHKVHEGGNAFWGWEHTDDRIEQIFIADITYRNILSQNLVFELKNRYNYNSFNSHQYLRLRPGLTYIYKRDGLAFMNFYLQHETYHPLSGYSKESVYERWIYLGALYHLSRHYKVGGFAALRENHWESGLVRSNVFGVNLVVTL